MGDFDGLTFKRLSRANRSRLVRWHPPNTQQWSLADWSNAMQGEAGECGNFIKKLRRLETGTAFPKRGVDDLDENILAKKAGLEIADTVIYADLLAQELQRKYGGYPLEELITTKFNAVSRREGFPERL